MRVLKKKHLVIIFVFVLFVAALLSGCNHAAKEPSQAVIEATDGITLNPSEEATESTSSNTPTAPTPELQNAVDIEKVQACATDLPDVNISIPVITHRQEGTQIIASTVLWDVANGGFTAGQDCYSYNANEPLFTTCWDGEQHFWGTDKQTILTNDSYIYTGTQTIPYGTCYYLEGKLWHVNRDGTQTELPMPATPDSSVDFSDALQNRPLYAGYTGDEIVLIYHAMVSPEQYGLAYCRYKPEAVEEAQWDSLVLLCEADYPFVHADALCDGETLYLSLQGCVIAVDLSQGAVCRLGDIDRLIASHGEQPSHENSGYIDIVGCYEDVAIVYVGPLVTGDVTHSYFCAVRQGRLIGSVSYVTGIDEESADGSMFRAWNFIDSAGHSRLAAQAVEEPQLPLLRFPCDG